MKKKITIISLIFALMIVCLFLFNTTSYAGSQSINDLNYEVTLNEDGSANVIETWQVQVSDTNTLFKTFKIDNSKYRKITNVKVQEIENGIKKDFIQTDTYAYHVEKGKFYALNTNSSEFEIAWGVSIGNSKNKEYRISYKIEDVVKNYNDCSEFYWQFIGKTNEIPIKNIKGTIRLPIEVKAKDNLRVWAHGPLNGEIYAVDNRTVEFEVSYISAQTMLEVRLAVLDKIFMGNTIDSNKLNSIIEEETGWANKANQERDILRRQKEQERRMIFILLVIVSTIGIVCFIILITKIKKYSKVLKKTKKLKPDQEIKYFREIPDEDATPAEAAFLYYFDKIGEFSSNKSKIVSATILNLALKKAIIFEEDAKEKVHIIITNPLNVEILKEDEKSIYDLLLKVEEYKNKKSKETKTGITMKDIERYAKNNDRIFLAKVDGLEEKAKIINENKEKYDKKAVKESEKWQSKKISYIALTFVSIMTSMIIVPIILIIPCMICTIICGKIAKKSRNLTQIGANEQEQWKGLKRYMEEFSLLNEREVPELVLWEKYLVFATAFGVADKVLKQLKVKYPELMDENYMLNNGYMYMYMINRYNFDRVMNQSMQRAYSAGIYAKQAREAASSSSYSSGGGFRWRIFWRRPEAGGGGRPEWVEDRIYNFCNRVDFLSTLFLL